MLSEEQKARFKKLVPNYPDISEPDIFDDWLYWKTDAKVTGDYSLYKTFLTGIKKEFIVAYAKAETKEWHATYKQILDLIKAELREIKVRASEELLPF